MIGQPSTGERALLWYARHFPLRRGKARVVNALWRRFAGATGTSRMAELKYGGIRVASDIAEMLHRQFYFFGTYFFEEEILDAWRRQARRANVVFDVGANAGIFSLAAIAERPSAIVHAFEPTPEIAADLVETTRLNGLGSIHVHQIAVGSKDTDGFLVRFSGEDNANGGMNFVRTSDEHPVSERVRVMRLDTFCRRHHIENIDLMKIDVQGNENAVLEGAHDLLKDGRIATLFLELNWADDPARCPARECLELLAANGYQFSAPSEPMVWRKAGAWTRTLKDIVARCPRAGGVA